MTISSNRNATIRPIDDAPGNVDQAVADGRLLAAAPDLFAACEAISESFDASGEYRFHTSECSIAEGVVRVVREIKRLFQGVLR